MRSIIFSTGLRYAALLLLVTDLAGGSPPALAQTSTTPAAAPSNELETVVVSARKREESIAEVPTSITAFTGENLKDYNIQSFTDYAIKTPNLSFSYGGGPTGFSDARTVAVRGITGQNLFGTAGATGFYIDDTPLPGSIDPRVVDLASIEVLKGPQGTLFGQSSLGGNVRLITRQPDLKNSGLGYGADIGMTSGGGSADGGANLVANVVLSQDFAALRVVLFGNHDAGYLTRTYPTSPNGPGAGDPFADVPRTSVGDQGAETTYGGSAALLVRATENLDIHLRLMFQEENYHGFPATFAPLPEFSPQYTIDRAFNEQPTASDQWTMPTLDFKYSGAGWSVVWANAYFYRHNNDVEDSSYGTQQSLTGSYYNVVGLPAQPYMWNGQHYHNQVSSELRLSFDPVHNLSGIVGLYYSYEHGQFTIPPTYATGLSSAQSTLPTCAATNFTNCTTFTQAFPTDQIWQQNNPNTEEDKSIFGELYYKFLQNWTLTLGARGYWLNQTTDYTAYGFQNISNLTVDGLTASDPQSNSQSGINPKVALAFQATAEAMIYASASKGFRAGGAQANFPSCTLPTLPTEDITHIQSDTLWTYEVGAKVQTSSTLVSAAVYDIEWTNPQQQVALPCGFYLQLNGGAARIVGGELEANGRLFQGMQYRFGLGYEKTELTDPGNLGLVPGITAGIRLPGVPAFNASLGAVYTRPLNSATDGFVSADYSYTGNSTALLVGGSFSPSPVATRAGYSLVNLRFGIDRGQSELSLNFRNLFNAKPNLGDIGYIGYAQYDTAGQVIPQVATLQPLTVTLQYTKSL